MTMSSGRVLALALAADPRGEKCNTTATCTLLKWVVKPPDPAMCPPVSTP